MLISVVTICRNCREMLLKTAASVAEQTFDDFEYVVVDGASTDGSAELLAAGGVSATKYVSEPDGGIYDAMNKGARLASGKWIVYMNAGDTFPGADTLRQVAAALVASDAGVVYGDAFLEHGAERVFKPGLEPANRHRMYFHHQSAYVRREVQLRFPFRLDVGLAGDYCFFKECMLAGVKFEHVAAAWCVYDCTGASSVSRMKVLKENIGVIRRYDALPDRLRFLPRLYFVVWWNGLRRLFSGR